MSSHGTNTADELQLLRNAVQERDALIKVPRNLTFETWSASNESVLNVSQGTGCTDARHAEAEATIASLRRKLRASEAMLATTQRSMETERRYAIEDRETMLATMQRSMETQRRYAMEDVETMVDKADSSLDSVNAGETLSPVQSVDLFTTALEDISAKGRAFLHQANKTHQSEPREPQTHMETIPSIQRQSIMGLTGDKPQKVQAPIPAANSFHRQAFRPETTIPPVVPQPQAAKVAAGLDQKPVSALKAKGSLIGGQLPVSKLASGSVSPWSGTKGVSASIAPRLPWQKQSSEDLKPSTSATDPSFPPLTHSGNNIAGQRKDVAPETRVDLQMPNNRGANAKPMNTEEVRQNTTVKLPPTFSFKHIPRPPMSARDAHKLTNSDEELEFTEGEDTYGVSDDEASKTRKATSTIEKDVEPTKVLDTQGKSTDPVHEESRSRSKKRRQEMQQSQLPARKRPRPSFP